MEKQDAKNIIVEVLQKVLAGQLKQESTLNPTSLAEAIMQKVEFSSSFAESQNKQIFIDVNALVISAQEDLNNLNESEKLLRNFAKGKLEAYQEIQELLTK